MKKFFIFLIIGLHFITICQSQVGNSTLLYIQDCNKAYTLDSLPILQSIHYEDSVVSSEVYIGSTVRVPYNSSVYFIAFGDTIEYSPVKKKDTLCMIFDNQAFSKEAIIRNKQLTFKEILISYLNKIAIDNKEKYNVQFDQLMYSVETLLKTSDTMYQRHDTILVDPYASIFGKGIILVVINDISNESGQEFDFSEYYPMPNYEEFVSKLIFYDIEDLLKLLDRDDVFVSGSRKEQNGNFTYSFKIKNLKHIIGEKLMLNIINRSGNLYLDEFKSINTYNYEVDDPKYFFAKRYIQSIYDSERNGNYPNRIEILVNSENSDNSHFSKIFSSFKLIENDSNNKFYNLKPAPSYNMTITNWIKYNLNLK